MWSDNETDIDFINFSGTAATVAEMIEKTKGKPVSIGVSGDWGVGKSSMIKLIQKDLKEREVQDDQKNKFVFVEFNAWLYQGYDDARAALMDVIATTLERESKDRQKGTDKVKEFLKRVNWVRLAKLSAETTGALALGIPPGVLSGVIGLAQKAMENKSVTEEQMTEAKGYISELGKLSSSLVSSTEKKSPPKEIQELRNSFEEALNELGITLVVFIDDLDRCLPETTISTLEAIRLFLFLKNTAFVIAADDKMIKHAVKKHFEGIDDDLVTNYFDKLIQIPIRVPALGIQEVRAYLFLLFIEDSNLEKAKKEEIRQKIGTQLAKSWQGLRVDKAYINSLKIPFSNELTARLDTADKLAHIMTTSDKIGGNPRLIKRFLNALSIRMSISSAQGVGVDEAVLIKMLLFERCGPSKAYTELRKSVLKNDKGEPSFLKEWEDKLSSGDSLELPENWNSGFVRDWLSLSPHLADKDLRGALYVSREHAPLITPDDKLSSLAAEVLSAFLSQPKMAASIKDRLKDLQLPELNIIMDRVLEKAKQEQEWGTPPILEVCLVLSQFDDSLATRFSGFLTQVPQSQIKADIIPKIGEEPWVIEVLEKWKEGKVSSPVKNALKKYLK